MGLFDDEPGLGLAKEAPVAYNVDNPLFKIGAALQGFSSGMLGRPNPAMEIFQHEMGLRQRRSQMEQQKEKDKLNEEKEDFDQVSKMLDIMVKSGADPKETTKVFRQAIKTMPRLSQRFGSVIDQIELTGKEGEFEWKGHKPEQDLTDVTGKVWPAGKTYNVKGKLQGGKIVPVSVEDIEAKAEIETAATKAANERAEKMMDYREGRDSVRDQQFNQNFQRLAAQNAASLSIQQQREARLAEADKRILPSQQKILTGNRQAMATIDDYGQAYDEFIKESKGATLSDLFRGAIAKNKNAQRASDLVQAEGRTDAERKLAAKYNALVGNIRALTDEVGVLTDIDAVRILGSFDPAQDRNQVKANLAARRKTHQRAYEMAVEDYQSLGKDVSKFTQDVKPKGEAAPTVQRSKSKSGKPIVSKDGGKTWTYE